MGKNDNNKNKQNNKKNQPIDTYIFKVIWGSQLYCIHSRGEKAGNQGENRLKEISGSLVGLKIPISDTHGLTSKLNQVSQGCVQWLQIPPRTKIVPLFVPFPAFDLPH